MAAELDPKLAEQHLLGADPVLARVVREVGPPTLRPRGSSPFQSLSRAIVYQQIHGAAAGAIYGRFMGLFEGAPETVDLDGWFPEPAEVVAASDEAMKSAGLSRQKIAALHDLARHFAEGLLSTEQFDDWADDEIVEHLIQVKGIGRWSAEIFLMMHLRRPDILPTNDVGINRAIMNLYDLDEMPKPDVVREIAEPWHPMCSAACLYLWHSLSIELP